MLQKPDILICYGQTEVRIDRMCAHRCALTWGIQRPCLFLQASRPLHYLVYFLKGVGIGAYGIERELLASEGKLARRWMLWCITALVAFGAAAAIAIASFSATSSPQVWETIGGVSFVLSCAASSFGFLALCAVRKSAQPSA